MFEIMALFPLFPGSNEMDQLAKIHDVMGTPSPELLSQIKCRDMDLNFPYREGTGIAALVPHISPEALDLIEKMIAYNADDRVSARQALKHPFFKELREADRARQRAALSTVDSTLSSLRGGRSGKPANARGKTVPAPPNAAKARGAKGIATPGGDGGLPPIEGKGKPVIHAWKGNEVLSNRVPTSNKANAPKAMPVLVKS
uniref:Protein kinase domain-containing protein n=1 Tax=Chlamydomonas euryale TaxID=1486919 RepID=A0A7R9V655_9CHLO